MVLGQSPSSSFLLAGLRLNEGGGNLENFAYFSDEEWGDALRQVVQHDIAPLLYHRLNTQHFAGVVPDPVLRMLRAITLRVAAENLRLYYDLAQILAAFQKRHMPILVLKGAYLAEIVYGNRALRSMGDVDLLFKKSDLAKAEGVLRELGYSGPRHPSEEVDLRHARSLVKNNGLKVDLHWAIERPTAPFSIDIEGLWKRAQPVTIAGAEVLALSPEDLLLHLCLHASFDHQFYYGLRALCDITETIRYHQSHLDWALVQARTREWGISKSVYLSLALTKEYTGALVSDEVIESLKPARFFPQVLLWAKDELFAAPHSDAALPVGLTQVWTHEGIRAKALLFWRRACPSVKDMAELYALSPTSTWVYLYYPLRWKDLLFQYGRPAWRLFRRDETVIGLAERKDQQLALKNWLASV